MSAVRKTYPVTYKAVIIFTHKIKTTDKAKATERALDLTVKACETLKHVDKVIGADINHIDVTIYDGNAMIMAA